MKLSEMDVVKRDRAKRAALDWKTGRHDWPTLCERHDIDSSWADAVADALLLVNASIACRQKFNAVTGRVTA